MNLVPTACADARLSPRSIMAAPADPEPDPRLVSAAQNDLCVLLTGPPTQASAVALRIHNLSGWRSGPFVVVDCGGTDAVIEWQLFDVLRVRQTAETATDPRPSLNQAGTVFLHEVGKLGLWAQVRLRNILDASDTGARRGRLRQRVMASTSEALLRRVLDGTFDEELFCRLNVIRLEVRHEDAVLAIAT